MVWWIRIKTQGDAVGNFIYLLQREVTRIQQYNTQGKYIILLCTICECRPQTDPVTQADHDLHHTVSREEVLRQCDHTFQIAGVRILVGNPEITRLVASPRHLEYRKWLLPLPGIFGNDVRLYTYDTWLNTYRYLYKSNASDNILTIHMVSGLTLKYYTHSNILNNNNLYT